MTDIQITDLTSTTSVTQGVANGTGVFDKLMNSVNLYLDDQYTSGRLNGTDYANVLLGSIQTVLAQSVQYALQEKLLEAQIDDVRKGIELKDAQLNSIVLDDTLKAKQLELAEVERLAKVYEKDVLLVDQHNTNLKQIEQITTQIDVAERQMVETESTGLLQRLDIDKGIEVKDQQIANMVDELVTSSKQRELLDEEIESAKLQQTILETEDLLKLAQVGKTNIEADVIAAMAVKDSNIKDQQYANMVSENKVLEQKVVGRKQSVVNAE
jgi:hypothetical protein